MYVYLIDVCVVHVVFIYIWVCAMCDMHMYTCVCSMCMVCVCFLNCSTIMNILQGDLALCPRLTIGETNTVGSSSLCLGAWEVLGGPGWNGGARVPRSDPPVCVPYRMLVLAEQIRLMVSSRERQSKEGSVPLCASLLVSTDGKLNYQ